MAGVRWGLEVAGHGVVLIRRKEHVLRDVDLDAVAFADRDGGWNVDEAVENVGARLREAGSDTGFVRLGAGFVKAFVEIGDLGCTGDDTQRDRRAEDLDIVVVDLVLQAGIPDLIETVELVEIDGVAIRHEQPMEGHGKTFLAQTSNLLDVTEDERALGDQEVLPIMAVHRVSDHDLQRPSELTIETICEYGVDGRALENNIGLAVGIV